ncbi:MAG: hypothetical protein ACETVT_03310, partial [bacterium]
AKRVPFDIIIVTAGAPEIPKTIVSETFLDQLNEDGGRLLIPVRTERARSLPGITYELLLVVRHGSTYKYLPIEYTSWVPLIGEYGYKDIEVDEEIYLGPPRLLEEPQDADSLAEAQDADSYFEKADGGMDPRMLIMQILKDLPYRVNVNNVDSLHRYIRTIPGIYKFCETKDDLIQILCGFDKGDFKNRPARAIIQEVELLKPLESSSNSKTKKSRTVRKSGKPSAVIGKEKDLTPRRFQAGIKKIKDKYIGKTEKRLLGSKRVIHAYKNLVKRIYYHPIEDEDYFEIITDADEYIVISYSNLTGKIRLVIVDEFKTKEGRVDYSRVKELLSDKKGSVEKIIYKAKNPPLSARVFLECIDEGRNVLTSIVIAEAKDPVRSHEIYNELLEELGDAKARTLATGEDAEISYDNYRKLQEDGWDNVEAYHIAKPKPYDIYDKLCKEGLDAVEAYDIAKREDREISFRVYMDLRMKGKGREPAWIIAASGNPSGAKDKYLELLAQDVERAEALERAVTTVFIEIKKKIFGKNIENWLEKHKEKGDSSVLSEAVEFLLSNRDFVAKIKNPEADFGLQLIRFAVENGIPLGTKSLQLFTVALKSKAPPNLKKHIKIVWLPIVSFINLKVTTDPELKKRKEARKVAKQVRDAIKAERIQAYLEREEFQELPTKEARFLELVARIVDLGLPLDAKNLSEVFTYLPEMLSENVSKNDIESVEFPLTIFKNVREAQRIFRNVREAYKIYKQVRTALRDNRINTYVTSGELQKFPVKDRVGALIAMIKKCGLTLDTRDPGKVFAVLPEEVRSLVSETFRIHQKGKGLNEEDIRAIIDAPSTVKTKLEDLPPYASLREKTVNRLKQLGREGGRLGRLYAGVARMLNNCEIYLIRVPSCYYGIKIDSKEAFSFGYADMVHNRLYIPENLVRYLMENGKKDEAIALLAYLATGLLSVQHFKGGRGPQEMAEFIEWQICRGPEEGNSNLDSILNILIKQHLAYQNALLLDNLFKMNRKGEPIVQKVSLREDALWAAQRSESFLKEAPEKIRELCSNDIEKARQTVRWFLHPDNCNIYDRFDIFIQTLFSAKTKLRSKYAAVWGLKLMYYNDVIKEEALFDILQTGLYHSNIFVIRASLNGLFWIEGKEVEKRAEGILIEFLNKRAEKKRYRIEIFEEIIQCFYKMTGQRKKQKEYKRKYNRMWTGLKEDARQKLLDVDKGKKSALSRQTQQPESEDGSERRAFRAKSGRRWGWGATVSGLASLGALILMGLPILWAVIDGLLFAWAGIKYFVMGGATYKKMKEAGFTPEDARQQAISLSTIDYKEFARLLEEGASRNDLIVELTGASRASPKISLDPRAIKAFVDLATSKSIIDRLAARGIMFHEKVENRSNSHFVGMLALGIFPWIGLWIIRPYAKKLLSLIRTSPEPGIARISYKELLWRSGYQGYRGIKRLARNGLWNLRNLVFLDGSSEHKDEKPLSIIGKDKRDNINMMERFLIEFEDFMNSSKDIDKGMTISVRLMEMEILLEVLGIFSKSGFQKFQTSMERLQELLVQGKMQKQNGTIRKEIGIINDYLFPMGYYICCLDTVEQEPRFRLKCYRIDKIQKFQTNGKTVEVAYLERLRKHDMDKPDITGTRIDASPRDDLIIIPKDESFAIIRDIVFPALTGNLKAVWGCDLSESEMSVARALVEKDLETIMETVKVDSPLEKIRTLAKLLEEYVPLKQLFTEKMRSVDIYEIDKLMQKLTKISRDIAHELEGMLFSRRDIVSDSSQRDYIMEWRNLVESINAINGEIQEDYYRRIIERIEEALALSRGVYEVERKFNEGNSRSEFMAVCAKLARTSPFGINLLQTFRILRSEQVQEVDPDKFDAATMVFAELKAKLAPETRTNVELLNKVVDSEVKKCQAILEKAYASEKEQGNELLIDFTSFWEGNKHFIPIIKNKKCLKGHKFYKQALNGSDSFEGIKP